MEPRLDEPTPTCYPACHEEHLHHDLLHYYLLTSVAGCSLSFHNRTDLGKPAA